METNGGAQAHALAADMITVTAAGPAAGSAAGPLFERVAVVPDHFGVERFVTAYKRD